MDQIGARPCLFIDEVKTNTMRDMFIFLFEFFIATFLVVVVLPFLTVYIIYRIGFKNTIKLIKRYNREYNRTM